METSDFSISACPLPQKKGGKGKRNCEDRIKIIF
jgi:hypothetical protein